VVAVVDARGLLLVASQRTSADNSPLIVANSVSDDQEIVSIWVMAPECLRC